MGFPSGAVVKDSPTKAEDIGEVGLILGSRRSPGEEMATHTSILVWEISWTEEPGKQQALGLQKLNMT